IVQPIVPKVNTIIAVNRFSLSIECAFFVKICSANNNKTPINPKINPNSVGTLEKFSFHFGLSKIINQMAVAADKMETIPLEIYCSDQIIAAISTKSNKNPTSAASLTGFLI